MQRLGILGGTFNPPHLGHIYIAREAMKGAELEKMLFIPCGNPPHKSASGIVDAAHRFEMTRIAIRNFSDFEITDLEMRSEAKSYSAKTLEILKGLYPDSTLCFVVGGDSLRDMDKWYRPEKIFELAEIIALNRGGIKTKTFNDSVEFYRNKYNAKITEVDISPIEVSSSKIRELIANDEDVSDILDDEVLKYIKKFGIYKDRI